MNEENKEALFLLTVGPFLFIAAAFVMLFRMIFHWLDPYGGWNK